MEIPEGVKQFEKFNFFPPSMTIWKFGTENGVAFVSVVLV
jgi:hypothetical protein